jgi:hypothetical protein
VVADLQAIDRECRNVSEQMRRAEQRAQYEKLPALQKQLDDLLEAWHAAIQAMTSLGYKRTDDERWVPAK